MFNTIHRTEQDTIRVPGPVARNKQLHDVLSGRHGGRMKSVKDHNRQREKQELRRLPIEE